MQNLIETEHLFVEHKFTQLDLSGHHLIEKEFDGCFFDGCHFSDVIFEQCKFYECRFVNCNLSLASVKGCSFYDTSFEECKVVGVNWTKAAWPRIKLNSPLNFTKCILNNSSFFGLGLKEISMIECKVKEVDFRESDCTEANFTYSDFENSLFNKTNLTQADFREAVNYQIDIFFNNIKKAKFSLPEAMSLLASLDIELTD